MFLQPTSPAQQVLFLDFNFSLTLLDPKKTLGIKLPFLVMIIKNLKKYFTFEVQVFCAKNARIVNLQVLDDKNVRRRFRASNYQSTTRVKPFICTMPMRLDDGWNQIQFNLSGNLLPVNNLFLNLFAHRFHKKSVRNELYRNSARADTRQLPHPTCLLLG